MRSGTPCVLVTSRPVPNSQPRLDRWDGGSTRSEAGTARSIQEHSARDFKLRNYPRYRLSDYPVGVDDFRNTFPPHRRQEIRTAIFHVHRKHVANQRWVNRQMQAMLELPDIVRKLRAVPTLVTRRQSAAPPRVAEGQTGRTAAGLSARFSAPCSFARRLQDRESDTGYDTRRRASDGAFAGVSQTAVYDTG